MLRVMVGVYSYVAVRLGRWSGTGGVCPEGDKCRTFRGGSVALRSANWFRNMKAEELAAASLEMVLWRDGPGGRATRGIRRTRKLCEMWRDDAAGRSRDPMTSRPAIDTTHDVDGRVATPVFPSRPGQRCIAGSAPATPATMNSSSLDARRRLELDATNTTRQGR